MLLFCSVENEELRLAFEYLRGSVTVANRRAQANSTDDNLLGYAPFVVTLPFA